jgi:hypothetical protein
MIGVDEVYPQLQDWRGVDAVRERGMKRSKGRFFMGAKV